MIRKYLLLTLLCLSLTTSFVYSQENLQLSEIETIISSYLDEHKGEMGLDTKDFEEIVINNKS